MKSTLRKVLALIALAVLFSPTYPVLASLINHPQQDPELSAIQAEYYDIAPMVDRLQ